MSYARSAGPFEDRPCVDCGAPASVPVRLRAEIPVYCKPCEAKQYAEYLRLKDQREADAARDFFDGFAGSIGVPPRYLSSSLLTWRGQIPKDESGSREWARQWISNPDRNVVLSGSAGSGKTHLAVSLLRGLWEDRGILHGLMFYPVPLLNADLIADMKSESSSCIQRRLARSNVVLFDDVARLRETKFASEELATIIYARHAEERIGIFTTNRPPRELYQGNEKEGYPGDAPTWSRVLEGAIVVTDFPKTDMRLKPQ